jgi:hypothetical protein
LYLHRKDEIDERFNSDAGYALYRAIEDKFLVWYRNITLFQYDFNIHNKDYFDFLFDYKSLLHSLIMEEERLSFYNSSIWNILKINRNSKTNY